MFQSTYLPTHRERQRDIERHTERESLCLSSRHTFQTYSILIQKDLDEYDRLEVFEVYSRELEREETERKRKEKDERRRRERKSRESFEDFLRQKLSEGGFSVKTKWRDYRENIKELPVYKGMIGQSGYVSVSLSTRDSTHPSLYFS